MSIEGEIVADVVVDQGAPAATESKPTNPILDPQVDEEVVQSDEPKVEKDDAEQPVPKGVQRRIDRAVRQKYEAEARAKMLEERLAALEQRQPVRAVESDDKAPTLDQFDSFDQYVDAKAAWTAERKIKEALDAREQEQASKREVEIRNSIEAEWTKRITQATDEIPDFEDVIASSDAPMTPVMQDAIKMSDVGPKIAYFLANNPDEAYKIAQMPPIRAIAALGRLEERLSAPAQKKTTSAPPPVKPVAGKAALKKDPGQMSDEEYMKWRKSGKA